MPLKNSLVRQHLSACTAHRTRTADVLLAHNPVSRLKIDQIYLSAAIQNRYSHMQESKCCSAHRILQRSKFAESCKAARITCECRTTSMKSLQWADCRSGEKKTGGAQRRREVEGQSMDIKGVCLGCEHINTKGCSGRGDITPVARLEVQGYGFLVQSSSTQGMYRSAAR